MSNSASASASASVSDSARRITETFRNFAKHKETPVSNPPPMKTFGTPAGKRKTTSAGPHAKIVAATNVKRLKTDSLTSVTPYQLAFERTYGQLKHVERLPLQVKTKEGQEVPEYHQCCWWCTEPWDGPQFHCPVRWHDVSNTVFVEGFFCSENCCRAYIENYMAPSKVAQLSSLLLRLHNVMYHLKCTPANRHRSEAQSHTVCLNAPQDCHLFNGIRCAIVPSPHWSTLRKFGGVYSIEEFRKLNCAGRKIFVWPDRLHLSFSGFHVYERETGKTLPPFAKIHNQQSKSATVVVTQPSSSQPSSKPKTTRPSDISAASSVSSSSSSSDYSSSSSPAAVAAATITKKKQQPQPSDQSSSSKDDSSYSSDRHSYEVDSNPMYTMYQTKQFIRRHMAKENKQKQQSNSNSLIKSMGLRVVNN